MTFFFGAIDRPDELYYIFLSEAFWLRWLTFLDSWAVIVAVLLFWVYLFLLTLVFVLQWLLLLWGIFIILLSQLPLIFLQTQQRMLLFIWQLLLILVLIGMVFEIISEMFQWLISSNLLNFLSRCRLLKYMSISLLIVNIRSSLIHLHGFQQHLLLS